MTTYPNPPQDYDPDGVDPDPYAFPFPVIGEPIAGYSDSPEIVPDSLFRSPGTEVPGETRRRDRDYRIPRAAPRDVLG